MSNRKITDHQFSAGTTIDATQIDQSLEDAIKSINEIEQINGRWTPTNYAAHWSPARAEKRSNSEPNANGALNNRTRIHPLIYAGSYEHCFPFLVCRNWNDEYYPRIRSSTPNTETHNEWRHKGFIRDVDDINTELWCRGSGNNYIPVSSDPSDSGPGTSYTDVNEDLFPIRNGYRPYTTTGNNGYTDDPSLTNNTAIHPMSNKYHAVTFSYYFTEPVILSAINVVAAQEHPISYHGSGIGTVPPNLYYGLPVGSDGFKDAPLQATSYNEVMTVTSNAAKHIELTTDPQYNLNETGAEYWGAYSSACGGDKLQGTTPVGLPTGKNPFLSCQVLVDNEFNSEERKLNDIAFQTFSRNNSENGGRDDWFHSTFPTANRSGLNPGAGPTYDTMDPQYPGGTTWGVFIKKQNLNIPIPRNSRVRFSIIVRGWLTTQGFEWNSNLTVLEQTET